MRVFTYPRCCEMSGMGRPPTRRFVWRVGQMTAEVAAELPAETVELIARGIEDLVGRAASRSHPLLPCPVPDEGMRLGPVTLELVGDDVRIVAWPQGADISGPVSPEPPALVVLLKPECARAVGASCRAALSVSEERCPFCGETLSDQGHVCPRANGYRR